MKMPLSDWPRRPRTAAMANQGGSICGERDGEAVVVILKVIEGRAGGEPPSRSFPRPPFIRKGCPGV